VGTLNLLSVLRDNGVDKFVFSSSCATYGHPRSELISEDHPQLPVSPYGQSKLMIESVLRDLNVAYGQAPSPCATSTPPVLIGARRLESCTNRRLT
jgi:UDP-glucose 4-epimerase